MRFLLEKRLLIFIVNEVFLTTLTFSELVSTHNATMDNSSIADFPSPDVNSTDITVSTTQDIGQSSPVSTSQDIGHSSPVSTTQEIGQSSPSIGDSQRQLLRSLFSDYEKDLRPVCEELTTTNVTLDLALRQLVKLDAPKQTLSINAWLSMSWRDCRLHWNSSHYRNTDSLKIPSGMIWKPDVKLADSVDQ